MEELKNMDALYSDFENTTNETITNMKRKDITQRYQREFAREEERLLSLHQPWHYQTLFVMYEIVELLDSDLSIDTETLDKFGRYSLPELCDKVNDILDNATDRQPVWSVALETVEMSER